MILEVKGLKKYFPIEQGIFRHASGFVKAIDGISFSLNEKETLGIVGESGCGKSTLAKLILRLLNPDAGEVVFSGLIRELRKDVGIVFQDPLLSLDPRMRLKDMLREPFLARGLKRKADSEIGSLLGEVGLGSDILSRHPAQLSGGQRQRACIARALASRPKLLVLDEPLSSLDLIAQKQILELLSGLRKRLELTYIFISHNIAVVKQISTRVMVMQSGKVVEEGMAREVLGEPKSEYTKKLLEAAK
ncbi:ABC transporter ATP-binding protein [bacterium]|nr:MAG: ABC transporter ATP-binding protein [bacterium]